MDVMVFYFQLHILLSISLCIYVYIYTHTHLCIADVFSIYINFQFFSFSGLSIVYFIWSLWRSCSWILKTCRESSNHKEGFWERWGLCHHPYHQIPIDCWQLLLIHGIKRCTRLRTVLQILILRGKRRRKKR